MIKTYTEHIPEKIIKTSDIKEKKIKAHTIRCPYDTAKIKDKCCICQAAIAGTEETYILRGNYCPQCSASTAEQNFTRINSQTNDESINA